MTTLLQIVNQVLRRNGQQEVATLSNATTPARQTVDFINHVVADLVFTLDANRLIQSTSFSTVNGTRAYSLSPTDANIGNLLGDSVYINGQPLLEVDYTHPLANDPSAATGTPRRFYRQGNQLHLLPTPNAVLVVNYRYRTLPVALVNDADVLALPSDWEPVIILGALALLEKFLGDDGFGTTYTLYRDGVSQLRKASNIKPFPRMRGAYRGYPHHSPFGGGDDAA
ncbi:MAG: hypothetical protein QE263_04220 [Vampirovibrionales bacterium]|nr:hypothetical protein [Vampirovibrionales bacterium]